VTSVDDPPDPSFTAQGRSGPRDAVRNAHGRPRVGADGTERRSRLRAAERETPATLCRATFELVEHRFRSGDPPQRLDAKRAEASRCRLDDGIGPPGVGIGAPCARVRSRTPQQGASRSRRVARRKAPATGRLRFVPRRRRAHQGCERIASSTRCANATASQPSSPVTGGSLRSWTATRNASSSSASGLRSPTW
jgi:hypothetical protein